MGVSIHSMNDDFRFALFNAVADPKSKTHAKITKAARKQAEELRMQYRRSESIIKLAEINRSQILSILSNQKIKTGFHH